MPQTDIQAFTSKLDRINQILNEPQNQKLLDNDITLALQQTSNDIKKNISSNNEEGRKLAIGIMGAMKAGKSSFLNALLFDSEDVLPKASTPMTAALTVLSYAPQSKAIITYFTQEDWQLIEQAVNKVEQLVQEQLAAERQRKSFNQDPVGRKTPDGTGMPPETSNENLIDKLKKKYTQIKKTLTLRTEQEIRNAILADNENLRSYYELYDSVRKTGLNVAQYLGKEEVITAKNDDWSQFLKSLNEYVGAKGKLTPLVNYITLELNNEDLKDLKIIDTPGLNDPFTSRSNRTRSFLGTCDVVLYVCSVSQFITKQDVDFICNDMQENATADAYIIGSQIDNGVLQYDSKEHSFVAAYQKSTAIYNRQARDTLKAQPLTPLIRKILDKQPPKYISSMMFAIGRKKQQNLPLDEAESNILKLMQNQYTDFNKAFGKAEDYLDVAGIAAIRTDVLAKIKEQKQELMADKNRKYITNKTSVLLDTLSSLRKELGFKLKALNDNTHDPQKQLKELQNVLEAVRFDIGVTLREYGHDLDKQIQRIKLEVAKKMHDHEELKTHHDSNTSTSHSSYLLIFNKTTTTNRDFDYAKTADVAKNIRDYALDGMDFINSTLEKVDFRGNLMAQLKPHLSKVFDLSGSNIRPEQLLDPINHCLSEFDFPKVSDKHEAKARETLSKDYPNNNVEGKQIHQLNNSQILYLEMVRDSLWQELDDNLNQVQAILNRQSVELCDQVAEKLKKNCEQLEDMIKNREHSINSIEQLMTLITQFQQDLTA